VAPSGPSWRTKLAHSKGCGSAAQNWLAVSTPPFQACASTPSATCSRRTPSTAGGATIAPSGTHQRSAGSSPSACAAVATTCASQNHTCARLPAKLMKLSVCAKGLRVRNCSAAAAARLRRASVAGSGREMKRVSWRETIHSA